MESQIVLNLNHQPDNPRNSEGAFLTLKNGRIMYAYSRYSGDSWSDHAPACIAVRTSNDNGKTWTAQDRIIVQNEGGCNVMSVSLLRLQNGNIALFYLRKNGVDDCRPMLRTSADEAKTWSDPVPCITAPGYFVLNNDRVIQLSNGRLLLAVSYHRTKSENGELGLDGRGIMLSYYSDDDGQTWHEGQDWLALPARSNSGLQEPGVIELANGDVFSWARTDTGRQWQTRSKDCGNTWAWPRPSAFLSPCSPLSMKRNPFTDKLVAIWNDHDERWNMPAAESSSWHRTPLVLAQSIDQGKTWQEHTLIENDPMRGFCYIAIHFIKDGMLLAYCCGGRNSKVLQDSCIRQILW